MLGRTALLLVSVWTVAEGAAPLPAFLSDQPAEATERSAGECIGDVTSLCAALTIACKKDVVIVSVRKDVFAGSTQLKASVGDADDADCQASPQLSNTTHWVLVTQYDLCDTRSRTAPMRHVVLHTSKVVVRQQASWDPGINGTAGIYPVIQGFQCAVRDADNLGSLPVRPAAEQLGTSNLSFHMELYDTRWGQSNPWVTFPHNMYMAEHLYVQLRLDQDVADSDLRAIPLDCYFAKTSSAADTSDERHMLIAESCPVKEGQTVAVAHSRSDGYRVTRFLASISEHGYFNGRQFIFLHCRVAACSIGGSRETEGYRTCRPSTYCSEESISAAPAIVVTPRFAYVSSGPLRPVNKPMPSPDVRCPPCNLSAAADAPLQHAYISVRDGLSVTTVFYVALASFLVGALLVAALWWAKETTELPQKGSAPGRACSCDSGCDSIASSALLDRYAVNEP